MPGLLSRGFLTVLFAITVHLFSISSYASISSKEQTPEEWARALKINTDYLRKFSSVKKGNPSGQPVLETDKFRYLLMSGNDFGDREMADMHRTFAQNLPADMILIVVTERQYAGSVKAKFAKWLPEDRFVVASGSNLGDYTWGRDSYPYPVYKDDQGTVELIAHEYYRAFSGQRLISDTVRSANTAYHNFVYVGGNLQAAANGDCFIVDSRRTFGLPDSQFLDVFRCKTLTRFPHLVGIGDIDEVIKVLPNNVILTNQESYRAKLESLGYQVVRLPEVTNSYRTYANSVVLNQTVFMPTYGGTLDDDAKKVYEGMGYKVIGIRSNGLSDDRHGSLHCLTMTYPEMDLTSLLSSLGLSDLTKN